MLYITISFIHFGRSNVIIFLVTNIDEKIKHAIYANPNMNYQILINALSKAKLTHMPKTTRRCYKRKNKKEKWMTHELFKQINKKNDMYVDWKTKSTTTEMYNNKKITLRWSTTSIIQKSEKNLIFLFSRNINIYTFKNHCTKFLFLKQLECVLILNILHAPLP